MATLEELEDLRQSIAQSSGVRRAAVGLWALLEKHGPGLADARELVRFASCVSKTLLAGCSNEHAQATARKALAGTDAMEANQFVEWVLGLAHLYCESSDPLEYEAFLVGLKLRIASVRVDAKKLKGPVDLEAKVSKIALSEDVKAFWRMQIAAGFADAWAPPKLPSCKSSSHCAQIVTLGATFSSDIPHIEKTAAQRGDLSVVSQKLADLDHVTPMPLHVGTKDPAEPHLLWSPQIAAQCDAPTLVDALLARYARHFGADTPKASLASSGARAIAAGEQEESPAYTRPVLNHARALAAGLGAVPPRIVIVGPPRTGKTTVAKFIADRTGVAYLESADACAHSLQSAYAATGGYVVDANGVIQAMTDADDDQNPSFPQPTVVVHLKMCAEDAAMRLAAMRVHPESGQVFTGADYRALEDAEENEAIRAAKAAEEAANAEEDPDAADEGQGDAEAGDDDEDAEAEAAPPKIGTKDLEPRYSASEIERMLAAYEESSAETLRGALHVITVDARLPLDRLVSSVHDRLSDESGGLAVDALTKAYIVPRPLLYKAPELARDVEEEGAGDEESEEVPLESPEEELELRQQLLYNVSVEYADKVERAADEDAEDAGDGPEDIPQLSPPQASFRHLSPWGLTCPVTFEEGRARFAVLWRGHVYFCASKDALESFTSTPAAFALVEPTRAGRVLVIAANAGFANAAAETLARGNGWTNMSTAAGSWHELTVEPEEEPEEGADDDASAETSEAKAEDAEEDDHVAEPKRRVHPLEPILESNRWVLAFGTDAETAPERALEVLEEAGRLPRIAVFVRPPPARAPSPRDADESEGSEDAPPADDATGAEPATGAEAAEAADPAEQAWAELCAARGLTFLTSTAKQDGPAASAEVEEATSREGEDAHQDGVPVEDVAVEGFSDPLWEIPASLDRIYAAKAIEDGSYKTRMGWSGAYCPVTLVTSQRLVPGKSEFLAFHALAFYTFATAAALETFQADPAAFERPEELVRPHPSVLLLGPSGAGKTASASFLAASFGLRTLSRRHVEAHVAARRLAREAIFEGTQLAASAMVLEQQPAATPEHDESGDQSEDPEPTESEDNSEDAAEPNEDGAEPVDEEAVAEARREADRAADEENRYQIVASAIREGGCVLDDVLDDMAQVERLAGDLLVPTVVLRFAVDPEIAVARTMEATFAWKPPQPNQLRAADGADGEPEDDPEPPQDLDELREAARAAWEEAVRARMAHVEETSAAMVQYWAEAGVPCRDRIDMSGKFGLQPALRLIRAAVHPHTRRGERALDAHQVSTVSLGMAARLREEGLAVGAPLGSRCPVELADQNRLCRCYAASPDRAGAEAVFYEGRIMMAVSRTSADRLIKNPGPFARRAAAWKDAPRELVRCSVVGGARGRSTAIARKLSEAVGAVYVSMDTAMEYVQARAGDEDSGGVWALGKRLRDGDWDANLVMQCVIARCQAEDATLRGFVLDQYPRTVADAQRLQSEDLLPDVLVHCGSLEGPFLGQLMDLEDYMSSWRTVDQVHVNARQSVWHAVHEATAVLFRAAEGPEEDHKAPSKESAVSGRLVDALGCLGAAALLESSPASGYCLATFAASSGETLTRGSPGTLARYEGQVFAFCGPQEAARFTASPSRYLEHLGPLQEAVKALPLSPAAMLAQGDRIGYLEHTLAPLLREGLEQCGIQRLKHPSLSIAESCAKFLALFLRAKNEKVSRSARARREQMLDQFLSECLLFEQITDNAVGGSGLRAARSCRNDVAARTALVDRFEDLLHQPPSILVARFTPSQ